MFKDFFEHSISLMLAEWVDKVVAIVTQFLGSICMRIRPIIAGHSAKSFITIDPGSDLGFIFFAIMESLLAANC